MTPADSSDSRVVRALKSLGRAEALAPDEVTRLRHLREIDRAGYPRRRGLAALSAAAAVLLVTVAVASRHDSETGRDGITATLQPLRQAPVLSPVPLERSEEWVILQVTAARASEVNNELTAAIGSEPTVISKASSSTTYVVPKSVALGLTDTTGITATPDTPVKLVGDPVQQNPVPSWGLDRLDSSTLDNSYSYVSPGAGVYVYVIDTGVLSSHTDFGGRVMSGYTAVSDGNGTQDCNGHGTHVAGTVAGTNYGVAKSATIVAVRVLNCSGAGYASSVVAGINWVVNSHPGGPGVINMSLGGTANSALDSAVASATAAGLVVAVAAGNSSDDACLYSPARAPSALTIGAIDKSGATAGYSNYGSCVDLWAPGSQITSAGISSTTASATMSGTSMASPHVAGLAARMLQARPSITSSGIVSVLSERSTTTNPAAPPVVEFAESPSFADPVTTTSVAESTTTSLEPATTTTLEPATSTTEAPSTTVSPTTTVVSPTSTTPKTTTTVPRSTTTVPGATTTVPKRRDDNEDKGKRRNTPVAAPREFKVKFGEDSSRNALSASWEDDGSPESWRIECATLSAGANAPAETTITLERADVRDSENGKKTAKLSLIPEAGSRCWIVAIVGTSVSARSNQAVVPPAPKKKRGDDDTPVTTTTVAPTTTTSTTTTTTVVETTTTAPPVTAVPTTAPTITAAPSTTVAPTTTIATAVAPKTTAAPKSSTSTTPPKKKVKKDD
jgi:subtilisin family serine protease